MSTHQPLLCGRNLHAFARAPLLAARCVLLFCALRGSGAAPAAPSPRPFPPDFSPARAPRRPAPAPRAPPAPRRPRRGAPAAAAAGEVSQSAKKPKRGRGKAGDADRDGKPAHGASSGTSVGGTYFADEWDEEDDGEEEAYLVRRMA